MKYIFLLLFIVFELNAGVVKATLQSVDNDQNSATISIDKIDVGVSGFAYHFITPEHSSILKNAEVVAFDKEKKLATLALSPYNGLKNNSLPRGKWQLVPGDEVLLAFNYSRSMLIAPSEEIYHYITQGVKTEWVHPDLFATILSYRGHPTPLDEDFEAMRVGVGVGLLFIYLDQKLYMLDLESFHILSISDAPLVQDSVQLPFYSRVEEIEANWFGAGSDELESYEPHYYELLVRYNKSNKTLYENIKNRDKKLHYLLKKFTLGETK